MSSGSVIPSWADPVGAAISKKDPSLDFLHLYTPAPDPNAKTGPATLPLLGGAPGSLGGLAGSVNTPQLYDPGMGAFLARAPTGGTFNQMAQQAAGAQYVPRPLVPPSTMPPGASAGPVSAPPAIPPTVPGAAGLDPRILQFLLQARGGPAMPAAPRVQP